MSATKGPITKFPAEDLRPARRYISTHNKDGKGVFIADDDGDHHRLMVQGQAVANIIYSTKGNPIDMNNEADIAYAKNNEVNYTHFHTSPTLSGRRICVYVVARRYFCC